MFLMKLGLYLGLFFALIGIIIIKVESPKIYKKISSFFDDDKRIIVWTISKDSNRLSLERNVFEYLNFRERNVLLDAKWDLIWSIEYPFNRYKEQIKGMKTYQCVNHFPGMSHLTIKKHLATKFMQHSFIPKGYIFPSMKSDFLAFIQEHSDAKFVEKNWNNRGVKLLGSVKDINHDAINEKEKFLQLFVENPFLIDGRFFDIGIYVLITSFNPLRVYKFDKEVLLRFCSENYHPLNLDNTKQYVIDDESFYAWNIKSLQENVLKINTTVKYAFELYMNKNGYTISDIWEQTDDAIIKLLLDVEENVIKESCIYGDPSKNFFEILRFDFILDEKIKVHLMEVNMSPHLTTLKDFANIKRNYRSQFIYDTLNLAVDGKKSTNDFMLSDERDVNTQVKSAMTESESYIAHQSYREHARKGARMKRIFPTSRHYNNNDLISRLSDTNKFSIKWFHTLCKINQDWC
ncbi:hypothetical protein PVAND_004472 [Polypedilum vanderplanki]|uniref:Tubulin-tyrosine ligase family protein n=1 Tax=Polypedilum vanderplanki TaxID=319348 RepID=A0A9J6BZ81_POLVA|nr:hypothetical protein PVAND_004472 [Polypedilum vanderplanki]